MAVDSPINIIPHLREIGQTPIDQLRVSQLRYLHLMPSEELSLVVTVAKNQQPPNHGVIAAAGGIALNRLWGDTPRADSTDELRSIAFTAFEGLRIGELG